MTIAFFNNKDEAMRVNKTADESNIVGFISGTLREQCSILTPSVTLDASDPLWNEDILTANYAFIDKFNRYYFVKNIESIRQNLWRFDLEVDVLKTYADQIRNLDAIIARNENDYNLQLQDGNFKINQKPRIETFPFPAGFNQQDFVLALAGASS